MTAFAVSAPQAEQSREGPDSTLLSRSRRELANDRYGQEEPFPNATLSDREGGSTQAALDGSVCFIRHRLDAPGYSPGDDSEWWTGAARAEPPRRRFTYSQQTPGPNILAALLS
jgi:hypothetical protein